MEIFLISAVAISIFVMGVSVGAILEHRIASARHHVHHVDAEIIELEPYYPLEESGDTECYQRMHQHTPVDLELLDPDATLDIPVYDELIKQRSHRQIQ